MVWSTYLKRSAVCYYTQLLYNLVGKGLVEKGKVSALHSDLLSVLGMVVLDRGR
jgi:hypothetical protein